MGGRVDEYEMMKKSINRDGGARMRKDEESGRVDEEMDCNSGVTRSKEVGWLPSEPAGPSSDNDRVEQG